MRILPFILLIGGVISVFNYFSAGNRVDQIKNLKENGIQAVAVLANEYKQVTKKSETYYETAYTFEVDGKEYGGTRKTYSEPDAPIVSISYLKEDPSINGYDLDSEQSEITSHDRSSFSLWGGIIAALIGLIWSFSRVKNLFKKKEA